MIQRLSKSGSVTNLGDYNNRKYTYMLFLTKNIFPTSINQNFYDYYYLFILFVAPQWQAVLATIASLSFVRLLNIDFPLEQKHQ